MLAMHCYAGEGNGKESPDDSSRRDRVRTARLNALRGKKWGGEGPFIHRTISLTHHSSSLIPVRVELYVLTLCIVIGQWHATIIHCAGAGSKENSKSSLLGTIFGSRQTSPPKLHRTIDQDLREEISKSMSRQISLS